MMAVSQRNPGGDKGIIPLGEKNDLSASEASLQRVLDYQYRFRGKGCLHSTANVSNGN